MMGVIKWRKNHWNIKDELEDLMVEMKVNRVVFCSSEDNKKYLEMINNGERLPENVYRYKTDSGAYSYRFYILKHHMLTDDEKNDYFQLKKLKYLKTIKNCLIYFVALAVSSIFLSFILVLA